VTPEPVNTVALERAVRQFPEVLSSARFGRSDNPYMALALDWFCTSWVEDIRAEYRRILAKET
jgi:hypothetical protein